MTRYAQNTTVSITKSLAEIERIVERFGASDFAYMTSKTGQSAVVFEINNRRVRFIISTPSETAQEFTQTSKGRARTASVRRELWEQARRQRWRALALVVKAKLEAIESGITEFEDEFMAHIVLPSGQTVGDFMKPQITQAYLEGTLPSMLPELTSAE